MTASILAGALVLILALTILALFLYGYLVTTDDAIKLAEILIPALTTLVAAILGYYYGTQPKPQLLERF